MNARTIQVRQVIDWRAALLAGFLAGTIFLILNLVLMPLFIGGNAWVIVRLFASIVLGESVVAPPDTFDLGITIAALIVHYALSIGFTLILAFITHRWGTLTGIILGALFGLALYTINFYSMTYFFPWFFAMKSWLFLVTHIIFGALAGGIYEGLEIERFVPVKRERT